MTKPFGMDELLARVRAVLRRLSTESESRFSQLVTLSSTLMSAELWSQAKTFDLRRRNSMSSSTWCAMRARLLRIKRCYKVFGAGSHPIRSSIFECSSISSVARLSLMPATHGIFSLNRGWVIDLTNSNKLTGRVGKVTNGIPVSRVQRPWKNTESARPSLYMSEVHVGLESGYKISHHRPVGYQLGAAVWLMLRQSLRIRFYGLQTKAELLWLWIKRL